MEQNSQPTSESTLPFWRQLRWSLVVIFVILAVAPVATVTLVTLVQTREQSKKQVILQLESITELKRDQITRWLENGRLTLEMFLSEPARADRFKIFASTSLELDQGSTSYATERNALNRLLRETVRSQTFFEEIFFYNTDGDIIAGSDSIQVGKIVAGRPYFETSLKESFVQPPYYAVGTNELTMVITRRLADDPGDQTVAVLVGRLNMETLGQIMTENPGLEDGETYLVSLENNYLVTPSRYQAEGYVLTRAYNSEGIERALVEKGQGDGTYLDYRDPPQPVIGFYRWLPELQVAMLAEVDEAAALKPSETARNFNLVLAAVAALVAIVVGVGSAARISRPIVALARIATQIAGGDLERQAQVIQQNEIGQLAAAFNSMTAQLREFIGSLEQRVAERTRNLQTAADVSSATTSVLDPDELLYQVVNLVRERFSLYYVGLFLLDEEKKFAVLRAGTGRAGRQMLDRGHRLEVGGSSMIGRCIAREQARIALHIGAEAVRRYANPVLPDTRSELAMPLRSRGQVIGAMTVQSDQESAFDETDIAVMQTMADQVGVAIDNARLFTETQAALDAAAATHRRYLRRAWTEYTSSRDVSGYQQTDVGLMTPLGEDVLPPVRQVMTGQSDGDDAEPSALVEPIILRGQPIGALGFRQKAGARQWSEDDVALAQTVASQLAQAIENLRLSEETERRAAREQLVGAVTSRMRESLEMDAVLRTAVREIRESLGLHSVMIQLEMADEPGLTQE